MGSCLSTPVDFEGEVNLYHFDLHRVVGKGAFGKVSISPGLLDFSYLDPGLCQAARRRAMWVPEYVFGCLCSLRVVCLFCPRCRLRSTAFDSIGSSPRSPVTVF